MGPPTFGRSMRRLEDPRLVTGAGTYVDDRQPAGLVHALFFRSYQANAVVRRLDLTGARQAPGVLAAWTDADLQELGSMPTEAPEEAAFVPERRPLANGRAHHVGQPLAVVIAESRQQARDAIDRIEMDLEPLPAVADVETATAPKAALVYPE
ncbi:MAG: xanthine dehydrogenase family protein molybdopterin-binding subunit, partial [Chloroflexi bacterium]